MKKLGLIILAINCFAFTYSQFVMKHDIHAFKAGEHNPMIYCTYLEPGLAGVNLTWDYSELRFKKSFEGFIYESGYSEESKLFPDANMELSEFDSRFFFKVSEDKIEQYGYTSFDGRSQIHYSTPFVKIKFPFAYSDAFSGIIKGTSQYGGTINSSITGSYFVEADAYGTLVLPGNTIYENTLRVRTEKEYVHHYQNMDQEIQIITYRWYNEMHRYPLLVLTAYTIKTGQSESTKFQAAYNVNALKSVSQLYAEDIEIYPNPTAKELNIRVNALSEGVYQFDIFDSSGKLIQSFFREALAVGLHSFNFSDKTSGLKPATYILIISNGNTRISKSFTLIE